MKAVWIAFLVMIVACGALGVSDPIPPITGQTKGANKAAQENTESKQQSPSKALAVVNATVTSDRQSTASNTQQKTNQESSKWPDPITLFTALLVAVGIAQVCFACLQWRTYRAQTEIFKVQNRAFVFLEKLDWEPMAISNDQEIQWRTIAIVKNSGNTPAGNLLMGIKGIRVAQDKLSFLEFAPDYRSAQKIFVGPQASVSIDGPQFNISDIERRSSENKQHWFVFGWMEYDDTFPSTERHRTEFCMELSPDLVIDLGENTTHRHVPRFVMHPRHNGADDECMHKPRPYQA